MDKYEIYFEIFGKKMKKIVMVDKRSNETAEDVLRKQLVLNIHKVEKIDDNDIFDVFNDIFRGDIFGVK